MENQQKPQENEIKSDKRSTLVLIAVALIILSFVFAFIALKQPRIRTEIPQSTIDVSTEPRSTVDSSQQIVSETESSTAQKVNANSPYSVKYPINLNTCTAEELMTIDKIGETRANAIIAYREQLGGYTSVEQLKNISGIGDTIYSAIEPYVTV